MNIIYGDQKSESLLLWQNSKERVMGKCSDGMEIFYILIRMGDF